MPIDPNIILGVRPVQIQQQDPLESYGKSLTLQNLMRQGDLQNLQYDEAKRASDSNQRIAALFAANPKATSAEVMGIDPTRGMAFRKSELEAEQAAATTAKNRAEATKAEYDNAIKRAEHAASVLDVAKRNPQAYPGVRMMLQAQYPELAKRLPEQYDPQAIDAEIAHGQTYVQRLTADLKERELAQKAANDPFQANGSPNVAVQAFQLDKAKKSAPNVQVKTDVKTGESLAQQIGPMMRDSTTIAEGAVKQADAAQRIVKAVDSGNLIAGPLANQRVTLAQVGQILGVGGKDEAEKIANTRQTVRGLAELTLQGRQQMKGQGAITESEGKLAEKAMSGDISELTLPEIRQLAKASERAARFNYAEHGRKLKVMQSNPDLSGIAPFYQGPAMPPEIVEPAKPVAGGVLTPNGDGSFRYGR